MSLIENRLIKNELTLKRYRRFKRNRIAVASFWVLLVMAFFSFTAEVWSNSKPVLMSVNGKLYAPVVFDYHPSEFGRSDIYVMDYRGLALGDSDWALWPINKWDPFESNKLVDSYPAAPSSDNIFGTDDRGRDVFARIIYGFRYSIIYSFGVWIISYFVGVIFGSTMGYLGGKFDLAGMRMVEIFQSVPSFLLLLTMIAVFSPSMWLLVFFTVAFDWTGIAVYMRSEFLSLRKREFVESARALGASHWRIIFSHILPNALTPIITFSPFHIAGGILYLSNLDFLGLGLQPPTPSWGELLTQANKYFTIAEWLVWWPSLFLVLTMVLLINIGLAVRDAYDAKATI